MKKKFIGFIAKIVGAIVGLAFLAYYLYRLWKDWKDKQKSKFFTDADYDARITTLVSKNAKLKADEVVSKFKEKFGG
jgi:hypothetical protein